MLQFYLSKVALSDTNMHNESVYTSTRPTCSMRLCKLGADFYRKLIVYFRIIIIFFKQLPILTLLLRFPLLFQIRGEGKMAILICSYCAPQGPAIAGTYIHVCTPNMTLHVWRSRVWSSRQCTVYGPNGRRPWNGVNWSGSPTPVRNNYRSSYLIKDRRGNVGEYHERNKLYPIIRDVPFDTRGGGMFLSLSATILFQNQTGNFEGNIF